MRPGQLEAGQKLVKRQLATPIDFPTFLTTIFCPVIPYITALGVCSRSLFQRGEENTIGCFFFYANPQLYLSEIGDLSVHT